MRPLKGAPSLQRPHATACDRTINAWGLQQFPKMWRPTPGCDELLSSYHERLIIGSIERNGSMLTAERPRVAPGRYTSSSIARCLWQGAFVGYSLKHISEHTNCKLQWRRSWHRTVIAGYNGLHFFRPRDEEHIEQSSRRGGNAM